MLLIRMQSWKHREPYAPNDGATKKEHQLKTSSSKQILPLPDLVFEAIVEERKKYEKNRRRRGNTTRVTLLYGRRNAGNKEIESRKCFGYGY